MRKSGNEVIASPTGINYLSLPTIELNDKPLVFMPMRGVRSSLS